MGALYNIFDAVEILWWVLKLFGMSRAKPNSPLPFCEIFLQKKMCFNKDFFLS